MAVPVVQAQGAFVGSVSGTITPAWPAHAAGDIGLLIVQTADWFGKGLTNRLLFNNINGFREVPGSPARDASSGGGEGPVPNAVNNSTQISVFWKRAASGAETAPSLLGSSDHQRACIITIRGANSVGNPIHKVAGFIGPDTQSAAISIPGFTTVDADCLVLDILGRTGGWTFTAWTNASLAALTQVLDSTDTTIGNGSGLTVMSGSKAVAGVVSATTATPSSPLFNSSIKLAITPTNAPADNTPYLANAGEIVESATVGISVPWPPHAAGDVALLIVESGAWPQTLSTPAGFVEISSSPQNSGSSGGTGSSLSVWWKRATTGAEASPTVAFITGAGRVKALILTFRGVVGSGNPWNVTAGDAPAATNLIAIPGATTTKGNCLVVAIGTHNFGNVYARSGFPQWVNADLEGMARFVDSGSAIVSSGIMIGKGRKVAAGVYGSTTASNLLSSSPQGRISIALSPAANSLVIDRTVYTTTFKPLTLRRTRVLVIAKATFTELFKPLTFRKGIGYVLVVANARFTTGAGQVIMVKRLSGGWSRQEKASNGWIPQTGLIP